MYVLAQYPASVVCSGRAMEGDLRAPEFAGGLALGLRRALEPELGFNSNSARERRVYRVGLDTFLVQSGLGRRPVRSSDAGASPHNRRCDIWFRPRDA